MATLTQLAAGMQTRLATVSGLNAEKVWPNSVTTPSAVPRVWPGRRQTLDTDRAYNFTIDVMLTFSENAQGQLDIYPYMDASGTKSILAALEGDETLGGIAEFISTDGDGEGWAGPPELRQLPQGGIVWGATLRGSIYVT